MARKIVIKRPDASTYRGWTFVIVLGLVVATLALFHRGGVAAPSLSDGSTGCRLEVAADELNVRDAPNATATLVEKLSRGAQVDGTRVVDNGFRALEGGRWAADQFLVAMPGTNCA